jgi:hypothetical protein
VTTGAFGAFSAISIYRGNETFFDNILMPLVHILNPETSHKVAISALKYGLFPRSSCKDPVTLVSYSEVDHSVSCLSWLVLKFLCDDCILINVFCYVYTRCHCSTVNILKES